MKKKILILALVFCSAFAASAADNQIGVSVSPQWMWAGDANDMTLLITVDGANYIGSDGSGIEYGIGTELEFLQGKTIAGVAARIGYGYRLEFNPLLGLSIGVGINGTYVPSVLEALSEFYIGMYGRIAVDFTFLDALRLNVGVGLGGPFFGTFTYEGDTYAGFMTGFYIAPYLGVSYAY